MGQRSDDSVSRFATAAVGGVLGGIGAWLIGRSIIQPRLFAASEDSPIMIKGGSLSVAMLDGWKWKTKQATDSYSLTSENSKNKTWIVRLAVLESGCPVGDSLWAPSREINLELTDGHGKSVDTISITFETDTLTFKASVDAAFGTNVVPDSPNSHRSKHHKKCAFHETIAGFKDFEISKVTCKGYPSFPPAQIKATDCVLAFEFD